MELSTLEALHARPNLLHSAPRDLLYLTTKQRNPILLPAETINSIAVFTQPEISYLVLGFAITIKGLLNLGIFLGRDECMVLRLTLFCSPKQ